MPGYTHLQVAMPSSFGLWFGAYAETLTDDLQLMQAVYKIVNQNPLGSAAGYGSGLPINRRRTTELLGFDDLNYNVVNAQMGRGKTEHFVTFGLAALGHTLAKMSMDMCLYINQNCQTKCHKMLRFTAPHLSIYDIIIQIVKSQKFCCPTPINGQT